VTRSPGYSSTTSSARISSSHTVVQKAFQGRGLSKVLATAEDQHTTPGGTDIAAHRTVDLNHVVRAGMTTYPGLPTPAIAAHLSREQSPEVYAPGTEFEIGRITMVGNTGTYLDSPYHRFPNGTDLAGLSLDSLVDLPAIVLRVAGTPARAVDSSLLATLGDVSGCAVLLNTGDDIRFGTPEYIQDPAFITSDGAQWLVDHDARLVGIDAVNVDDATDGTRPAHTLLLGAGIPIVEHLTALDQLPLHGARFTAVPPRIEAFGTFPVRAFAVV
jgi:arylformamidase